MRSGPSSARHQLSPRAWRRAGAGGCPRSRPAARAGRASGCAGRRAACGRDRARRAGPASRAAAAARGARTACPTTMRVAAARRRRTTPRAAPDAGRAAVEPGGLEPVAPTAPPPSRSGAMTSAAPGLARRPLDERASRRCAPVQSSGLRLGSPGARLRRRRRRRRAPRRGTGGKQGEEGRSPGREALLGRPAPERRARPATESAPPPPRARSASALPAPPSRSATTTPTRARPCSGALTRWPRRNRHALGRDDIGERTAASGISNTTSAIMSAARHGLVHVTPTPEGRGGRALVSGAWARPRPESPVGAPTRAGPASDRPRPSA